MLQDNPHGTLASQAPNTAPFDRNDRPTIALPPPASARTHQRSRTAVDLPPLFTRSSSTSPTRASTFLPFLRTTSRSVSPERVSVKEAAEFSVEGPSIDGSANKQKPSGAKEKLASWFEGCSEPVNISLVPSPRKERMDPFHSPETMQKIFSGSSESVDNLTRRPQMRSSISGPMPQTRFGFFRKPSNVHQATEMTDHDELGQLDIRDAIFPAGPPHEYSPAAFKNLQLNAEGTLRRFQNAYVEQQKVVRSLRSTNNVQSDELEAAQTRNEHLKLQLVDMAEKSAEQERLVAALRADLAVGRSSFNSPETQQRSIRMVSQDSGRHPTENITGTRARYRRNRCSDVSTSGESENGSDISSVTSVFSEAMCAADSRGTSIAASPVMKHATMHCTTVQHQSPVLQHSAIIHELDCQKCHGVPASDAWDVITMMKLESTALKDRIKELEGANDDAIDFLSGLKLS